MPATAWYRAVPIAGTGTAPLRAGVSSLARHVLRPGLHLAAHRRLRGAAIGRGLDDAVLLHVATEVAREAHPVAAVARQALVALPEVLQVVGVHQRRRRV